MSGMEVLFLHQTSAVLALLYVEFSLAWNDYWQDD